MEEIPVSLGLPSRRTATTSIVPPCLNVSTVIGRLCVFFSMLLRLQSLMFKSGVFLCLGLFLVCYSGVALTGALCEDKGWEGKRRKSHMTMSAQAGTRRLVRAAIQVAQVGRGRKG